MKKYRVVWDDVDGVEHIEVFELDTDGTETEDVLGDYCHQLLQQDGEYAEEIVSIEEIEEAHAG